MVFFVCEGCNESLKKNQVDKHASRCRSCYAVTCVDCNVTFYGDDFRAHTSCISEAEKYEGALYRAPKGGAGGNGNGNGGGTKKKKRSAQEQWMDVVEAVAADPSGAPSAALQQQLGALAGYSNVPRNEKKFVNFVKNSMNLRSDAAVAEMWAFLGQRLEADKKQQEAEEAKQQQEAEATKAKAAAAVVTEVKKPKAGVP